MQDIVIDKKKLESVKLIAVENISEVLKEALDWKGKQQILNKIMQSNGNQ
jgi:predicted ATP-dependent protease